MKFLAKWITAPCDMDAAACTFKKKFKLCSDVKRATLYASAMGIYAPFINGKRIGKGVLAPGWTSYKTRVQYQTYDVTDALLEENTLELGLGQGWAVGCIGYGNTNHFFADYASVIAFIDIRYKDGTRQIVGTDVSFEVYSSPVTFSEIYHGETIDFTAPISLLGNAKVATVNSKLIAQVGEDITEQERLHPVAFIVTPKGERVIDFGQNMTGYVEVSIRGKRGDRIVITHAEVLDRDGNFYNENYRKARNKMTYVCSGEDDVFKPTYSFQGFRYIRLDEYQGNEVDIDAFVAIAVNSDIRRTGDFTCGNEKINQLYHNIIWGQKSNYLDVPTDCPQRDERLGWTGDAQAFCRTAAINYDVEKFFKKWLGDVAIEQTPEGAVYGIVPHCLKGSTRISAAWGDVACIAPWQIYLAYGNKKLLAENYNLMKRWVDYMHSAGSEEYLWLGGMHYGDWLAMDAGGDTYEGATSTDLIASAFFAYSCSLLVKAADVLGYDASEYKELYTKVVAKFREYFMENGYPKAQLPYTEVLLRGKTDPIDKMRLGLTQTSLVLILYFDLCLDSERPLLAAKLAEMIKENGNRMTTGFVGTPYILHALSDNGYADLAYELLVQEENPSWLYSVCHGATTMWEHWNSQKEDGSFWSTAMNSFNHYAYGAVFDWIFGVAVGIKPREDGAGYRKIDLAPHPSKHLGYAKASIDSRCGRISTHWYYKGDTVYYEFDIPEGVTAYLTLPSGRATILKGGKHFFAE